MNTPSQVRVGVGCILIKGDMVLMGKRKGSHGQGEWAWPGGHLEFGETIEQCVEREISEETGMKVKPLYPVAMSNMIKYEKHYLDIQYVAEHVSGEPQVLEPDKIEMWQWFPLDNLPEPLFAMCKRGIAGYKVGKNISYFPE